MTTPRTNHARANARQGRAHAVAIDAQGWVDLLWVGRWQHADGPEACTPADIANVFGNLQAEANAQSADWPGIPFYTGHPEIDDRGAAAPAVAWAKEFRIVADRLQALVEWAGDNRQDLIESRAYKFLSAYEWGDLDDQGVFHPAYISSVGLTNMPVKREGQRPLANAGDSPMRNDPPPNPQTHPDLMARANAVGEDVAARISALIGGAATKEDALDLIYKELRRVWALESELDAMATMVSTMANAAACTLPEGDLQARCNALATALQAVCAERDELILENAVHDGAVKDTEQGRANALRLLKADREAAKAHFANAIPTRAQAANDPLAGRVPRRANAIADPAPIGGDQATADKILARANALMPTVRNWDAAFAQATKEIADTK